MTAICPPADPPIGGYNDLRKAQRKDSIFECIKSFLKFLAILHKKH